MSKPCELLSSLINELGADCVLSHPDQLEPYHQDWRGLVLGESLAVVRPAKVAQVCLLMAWANQHHSHGVCIVPVGGRTGLCGGALPLPDRNYHSVLLDLTQLNHIGTPNTIHGSIDVQAGAILAHVQKAAQAHGYVFPISLASEGSCTIGGNLASNAGGTAVLHYGMMRAQCLSLDVVLPTGELIHLGAGLHKDNSGYDLKHLWIGSEGTLGVIVGATLKLYPQASSYASVLIHNASEVSLLETFLSLRNQTGALLTTFELISARCVELIQQTKQLPSRLDHLFSVKTEQSCYALIELSLPPVLSSYSIDLLISAMSTLLEQGHILSVFVAQTQADRDLFWQLREAIPLAQTQAFQYQPSDKKHHAKHDVALPISGILPFLNRIRSELKVALGEFDEIVFGHIGDGNLHYNIAQLRSDQIARVNQLVYDCAVACGGSISAEHGIGYIRRSALERYLPQAHQTLMHTIKQAIDPNQIMNPNKVITSRNKHMGWGQANFEQAQQQLPADLATVPLIYVQTAESTNDLARKQLSHNRSCIVVAEHQTHGRGQRGRTWVSEPQQALLCSIGLSIKRVDLSGLSLVIGLCLRQGLIRYLSQQISDALLQNKLSESLKIKWPNDLYYNNQKLGGILIETHISQTNSNDVVIGFGLNLNQPSLRDLAQSSVSLQALYDTFNCATLNPATLWTELVGCIFLGCAQFEKLGFITFQQAFQDCLLWQDQPVLISQQDIFSDPFQAALPAVKADNATLSGICRGIDNTGALLLDTDKGLICLHSGSVRLNTNSV